MNFSRSALPFLLLLLGENLPAHGLIDPDLAGTVAEQTFEDSALKASATPVYRRAEDITDAVAGASAKNLESKYHQSGLRFDSFSGRVASFHPDVPVMPGQGKGNRLLWHIHSGAHDDQGRALEGNSHKPPNMGQAAVQAVRSWMMDNAADLNVDVAHELFATGTARVASHGDGKTIQMHAQRTFKGIPVVGSFATATVKMGNLISVSLDKWADIPEDFGVRPRITSDEAMKSLAEHAGRELAGGETGKPELVILVLADNGRRGRGRGRENFKDAGRNLRGLQSGGDRYTPVLAWRVHPTFVGQNQEEMMGYVKASNRSGRTYQFVDEVDYFQAMGDVYPISNDGEQPDGELQDEWPMPYMSIGGEISTTGGVFSGGGAASYEGPYVSMSDDCGTASLSASGDLDWGGSAGTDCDTPGFGGAGNTHSSRSGFYELNKLIEIAQSQLPNNNWLKQQLTSNMNINDSCNAFFSPSQGTINFFRSSANCGNTGELAAVFDHEWGHGMDWNDVNGGIAQPSGEGIADLYSALRLNDSCIGRGFFKNGLCNTGNNPCLAQHGCSGVRDIDWTKKARGTPDNLQWALDWCGTSVHCLGHVYAGAVWQLFKTELPDEHGMDDNTALELTQRLLYIAAGSVTMWYTKASSAVPWGGCGANSGYKAFLNADDDDGNLANGTPHMKAIYKAFNDHQIACDDIPVQDSGCDGTAELQKPVVTLSPGNNEMGIDWTAVAGVTYQLFRTEGLQQCSRGKVLLATTTDSTYTDTGLQNGREYSYIVIPKGEEDPTSSCFGHSSDCASATPVAGPGISLACPSDLVMSNTDDAPTSFIRDCTIAAAGGFTGTVAFSCVSELPGVDCTAPSDVVFTAGQTSKTVPLTFQVTTSAEVGDGDVTLTASSGSFVRSSSVPVSLFSPGGQQVAVYSQSRTAPFCQLVGSECSTISDDGATHLIKGRGNVGPETNTDNTIDACADGNSGSYLNDESLEWIKVSVDTGSDMTEGDLVKVEANAWCWSTGTSDSFDMYYTTTPEDPSWEQIAVDIQCPGGGFQTVSATYELPTGQIDGINAVRVQFRYNGSPGTCTSGNYNDRDDLVFTVKLEGEPSPAPTPAPVTPEPTPPPTPAPVTPNPTPLPTPAPVTPNPTPLPTPAPVTPNPTPSPTGDNPTPDTTAPTFFTCEMFNKDECPLAYGGGQCQWLGSCHNCGCRPTYRGS